MVERMRVKAEDFSPDEAIHRYDEGLIIDKDNLDVELQHNADTFAKVATAFALAGSIRDHIKQRLKEEEATAALEFRATARRQNEKFTVDEVKEAVIGDKRVKELNESFIKAERDVAILQGLRDAYRSRGSHLGTLADLHMSGYYGAGRSIGTGTNSKVANAKARQADEAARRRHDEEGPIRPARRARHDED